MTAAFRTIKPREPGSTKDVVSRLFDEAGGIKRVAFALGKGLSVTQAYADPQHRTEITFDQVRRLTSDQAIAAAEDLAAIAGGVFVPGIVPADALPILGAKAAEEWGQYIAAMLVAYADGRLCDRDRPRVREELNEAIAALVAVRARLISEET